VLLLRVEISCLIDLGSITATIGGHLILQYEKALIGGVVEVMVVVVVVVFGELQGRVGFVLGLELRVQDHAATGLHYLVVLF
jgi:hypothetical protein